MREFGRNRKPEDDITLLGLEYRGRKGEVPDLG